MALAFLLLTQSPPDMHSKYPLWFHRSPSLVIINLLDAVNLTFEAPYKPEVQGAKSLCKGIVTSTIGLSKEDDTTVSRISGCRVASMWVAGCWVF